MTLFPPHLLTLAQNVVDAARAKKLRITTAESCTGGLIGACLTEISGASNAFDRGFTTYSNESKTDLLNVPAEAIQKHGAVSDQVAAAMAEGALKASLADIAVSVTGIGGPGGGTPEKPVGLVHFGIYTHRGGHTLHHKFTGNRTEVRLKTVQTALELLQKEIDAQA